MTVDRIAGLIKISALTALLSSSLALPASNEGEGRQHHHGIFGLFNQHRDRAADQGGGNSTRPQRVSLFGHPNGEVTQITQFVRDIGIVLYNVFEYLLHRLEACPESCDPKYYYPVCGADDKTYNSRCHLRLKNCERAEHEFRIVVRHAGECGSWSNFIGGMMLYFMGDD